MSEPSVCALCLTADRQALTDRAVRSFLAQDYERKGLLIYDTGNVPYEPFWRTVDLASPLRSRGGSADLRDSNVTLVRMDLRGERVSIGKLRNWALELVSHAVTMQAQQELAHAFKSDIICHWDSDDVSMPTRISDQVKLLQESGKQAVGYREMLFWKRGKLRIRSDDFQCTDMPDEAWLYRNTDTRYIIGTSLCYKRATWEARPFPDCMIGEDRAWIRDLDTLGVSSCLNPEQWDAACTSAAIDTIKHYAHTGEKFTLDEATRIAERYIGPIMVAELHGGNTVKQTLDDPRQVNPDGTPYWTRTPEWDSRVRSILEGA